MWELIFYLLRTFCPHLGSFCVVRLQDSALLSEVAVNHLKKARGEIWPKRSEKKKQHKNYQDEDKKSAINKKLILRLRSLISKWFQLKTSTTT